MPVEEQIYQPSQQVGGSAPLPGASPDVFGAGVGSAVEQAGNELHGSQMRAMQAEKQRQAESDNASAGLGAAQLRLTLTNIAQSSRDDPNTPLDGSGHVDTVAKGADAAISDYLGTISDPKVRQRWQVQAADMRSTLLGAEDGWARGRRIDAVGTNVKDAGRLWDNQLQGDPTPDNLDAALKNVDTMLAGFDLPADTKKTLGTEQKSLRAENYATGLVEKDPRGALEVLQKGALDPWLDPDKKKALIDSAETGVRIADADVRRQTAAAAELVHVDAQGLSTRIANGELPSDDDVKGVIGRAQQLLPQVPAMQGVIDNLQHGFGVLKQSRVTDKWSLNEWAEHVDPLAAKVAAGKASGDEQQLLKIWQELRPAKEARFSRDPRQAAAAAGIPVPDFDPDNPTPQSVAAQGSWAEAWAKTSGLADAPYEPKAKLDVYRQQSLGGPVSQLQIAEDLRQTWGADRAASIVRQIGGDGRPDMTVMVGLEPRMADLYRKGIEQLKLPGFKFDDARAQALFLPFKRALPVELQGPVFGAARAITAGYAAEGSLAQAGGGNFDHAFSVAVHRAVGMLGDPATAGATGGFVQWNGRYAVLPQSMSRQDFQRRLSRAGPQDWLGAAVDPGGQPVKTIPYHLGPDGKPRPYTKGEAQRFGAAQLETVSPGIYRLIGLDGNPVVDQHGQPWQFDARRLP